MCSFTSSVTTFSEMGLGNQIIQDLSTEIMSLVSFSRKGERNVKGSARRLASEEWPRQHAKKLEKTTRNLKKR